MPGKLTGISWFLLVAHSLWTGVLSVNMYQFWERRDTMKIFSRWPSLALLSGCAGVIVQASVVVQEVMSQEGRVMPCVILLYLNSLVLVLYALPYLLRGIRAVILSHNGYKKRFTKYLSRGRVSTFMTTVFIAVLCVCAILQQLLPQLYGEHPTHECIYLAPWWFWGPVGFLTIALVSRVFLELSRLNDKTNLASEIFKVALMWLIFSVVYFPMAALIAHDIVEMPKLHGVLFWLVISLTLTSTFMIEPRRRRGKVVCWKKKKKKVVVVVDDAQTAAWKSTWPDAEIIMAHPILDQAFEKHAQDYMCSESYDFIKEVGVYRVEAERKPVDELFVLFRRIVNMYIVAGSELEINIATAMRKKVLEIGDKGSFVEASTQKRQDIFNPSRTEITKMINENLVNSFFASRLFLDACKLWQEQQHTETSTSTEARLQHEIGDEQYGRIEDVPVVQELSSIEQFSLRRSLEHDE